MQEKNTLLIVDDSKVSRMMIISIVKDMKPGWELVEAENGDEALKIADEQEIDYFSIDLNMPGIDGLETISRLLNNYAPSKMVLMTANIQETVSNRAMELGVECVHKPITPDSVAKMLEIFGG